MEGVRNVLRAIVSLVFPEERRFARFDSLPLDAIARTANSGMLTAADVPCLAPLPFDHAIVRDAIHAAKYHGHARAAALLGAVLAPCVGEELADRRMFGTFETILVVPVPLHRERLRERGYNQAERIARALVAELDDPSLTLAPQVLVRERSTPTQTHRAGRDERRANVRGAFLALPALVAGRDIVLLDDVITTGATLHAAERALTKAGARHVLCVAAAH